MLSLQQIIENRTSCVREIIEDKIYLKADSISISEQGIYVLLNEMGDCASIPMLRRDAAGCFIPFGLISENDYKTGDWANNYQKTCQGCGTSYLILAQMQIVP